MHPANRLEELGFADRLDQMYVEANFRRALAIALLSPPGESHQRRLLAPGFLAQASRSLVAIHLRHPEIEENDLRLEFAGHGQCLDAVVGHSNVVSGELEQHGERIGCVAIVVNDENAPSIDRDDRW